VNPESRHSDARTLKISGAERPRWLPFGRGALLVCVTLIAYLPALTGGLLWNDVDYVTQPPLQSWHGLWRIWSELGATEQYYPLLHSAFWVEHRLWGDATIGYHVINVLLHCGAAFLLVLILRRLSIPGAWLAAFIFALHPVCVESVAWISEQKNTLSTVFYLSAALAYLHFDRRGQASTVDTRVNSRGLTPYLLATGLFLLALLAKTVTATLPAALLVVIWWRWGRLTWKTDVLPLIPWFLLGSAAGLFSAWVERQFIGAKGPEFDLTLVQHCLLAGRVIWFYLVKLLWPSNLIFIYPRWETNPASWRQYLFPAGAAALVGAAWLMRRRTRGPLAALLFFIGSLFPVLGFFNVYAFIFSFVADHFQYLASLGVITLVAGAWGRWAGRPYLVRSQRIAAAAVICILGVLTWRQCRIYRDIQTFYRTTLDRNPDCWMAHNNLGDALFQMGRMAEAIDNYQEVVRLKPEFAAAHYYLGNALARTGRPTEAIAQYEQALRIKPGYVKARNDLGAALVDAGRLPEAIDQYEQALRIKPDTPEIYYNLGIALARAGRSPEAVARYEEALRIKPNYPEAQNNLGAVFAAAGRFAEATVHYEQALRLRPDYAEAHNNLGYVLFKIARPQEAIGHYETALRIKSDFLNAHKNLAVALTATGRLPEAIDQFEQALRLAPDDPALHHNLGVVLQAVGRTQEATIQFEQASRCEARRGLGPTP
jgi:tetratricopeptide (TPR) repeat protein